MPSQLVLTITADDQTGLIERIANAVAAAEGNWLESSLCQLAGKFAGIARVSVPPEHHPKLQASLDALKESGAHIYVEGYSAPVEPSQQALPAELLMVKVVANDRPGIVQEVTRLLASLNINVESFDSCCESAAMSADTLFEASAVLELPANLDQDALADHLEALSNDLMVEIHDLMQEPDEP